MQRSENRRQPFHVGSDEFPEMGKLGPKGAWMEQPVQHDDLCSPIVDAGIRYRNVAAGAEVTLRPVEDQFYGDRSGWVERSFWA